jgi:hypothetical protein
VPPTLTQSGTISQAGRGLCEGVAGAKLADELFHLPDKPAGVTNHPSTENASQTMCLIRIGVEPDDYLAIHVLGRSHPDCTDYWDGNWLRAEVDVVVGGFRGRVTGDLRSDELAQFHEELSRLHESLRGSAELATMENWLSIDVVGDGRGHMTFECEVRDAPGYGNTLRCEFGYDQTFIPPILAQLGKALLQYPVIGEP